MVICNTDLRKSKYIPINVFALILDPDGYSFKVSFGLPVQRLGTKVVLVPGVLPEHC